MVRDVVWDGCWCGEAAPKSRRLHWFGVWQEIFLLGQGSREKIPPAITQTLTTPEPVRSKARVVIGKS